MPLSTPPPDKLDYASTGVPPPIRPGYQVLIGLLVGAAASAVAWVLGWGLVMNSATALVIVLVILAGLKIVGGGALMFIGRWRLLGAGLLLSLALGFLIFVGNCFAHL